MTRPRLVVHDAVDDVSRVDVEMARISQSHREWRSPWADVTGASGWQSINTTADNPLDVDRVIGRQYRVMAGVPLPWHRRVVRWVKGINQ